MPESLRVTECATAACQVRQFLDQKPWEKKTWWTALSAIATGFIAVAVVIYKLQGGVLSAEQLGLIGTLTAGVNGILNGFASLFARQAAAEGIGALNDKVEVQSGTAGSS